MGITVSLDRSVPCQYTNGMSLQKLYKNGNSVAVTIPKEILKELQLKEGSEVMVTKQGTKVVIASKQAALAPDITPQFLQTVENFVTRHHNVLTELAQK